MHTILKWTYGLTAHLDGPKGKEGHKEYPKKEQKKNQDSVKTYPKNKRLEHR